MANSEGYLKVLKPYLLDKLNQSFPDPASFTKEEEFVYAAKVSSVFKKVVAELISWIDNKGAEADHLIKKGKCELTNNFQIGG